VSDLVVSEAAATAIERFLSEEFTRPLAARSLLDANTSLVDSGFRAIGFEPGDVATAGSLRAQWLRPAARPAASPAEFLASLDALSPLRDPERVETELIRFELEPSGNRATGLIRLRWAGIAAAAHPAPGTRTDLTLFAEIEVLQGARGWRLSAFRPAAPNHHAHGSGLLITGPPHPLLADRTDSVGLTLGTSRANRELIQSFINRHLTLALGGLSVTDFNGDERPDLIATRSEETSLVFLNDGNSGFVPQALPIQRTGDHPAFLLAVDLDGDGLDELVSSQVNDYEGALAYAGLWTRTQLQAQNPDQDQTPGNTVTGWRHIPRAFALPNPIGMRRVAVQNVVPVDVDGDNDLDLYFAVYGNAESRGEHYNSVEAHDGADNYLLINQGRLAFTEESDERGMTGTGYTYVGLSFDADHDGDFDILEGNDFGPNVLWRNEGGYFKADETMGLGGVSAYTMGAALADLDANGAWDLYVSNMSSEEGMRMVRHAPDLSDHMRSRVDTIARGNRLYREPTGGAGPWEERAQTLGVHEGEWAWGCQFIDIDGNGTEEILVTNGFASHEDPELGDWQTYYWRQVLDDAARLQRGETTADVNTQVRFQGSFNGHERDRLFLRVDGTDPDRPWIDGGYCLGFDDAHDGRAIAPMDADGDGDLDLVMLTLGGLEFRENLSPRSDRWIRLRVLNASGGPALGARIQLTASGQTLARHVAIVEGFQSQVSTDLHISLPPGSTSGIERLVVQWPDGSTEPLAAPPTGKLVTVTRGDPSPSTVEVATLPGWSADALSIPPAWRGEIRERVNNQRKTKAGSAPRLIAVGKARRGEATTGSAPEPMATAVVDSDGEVLRWFAGTGAPDAMEAFRQLGFAEPSSTALLIEHGRAALAESRYRDALKIFRQAVQGRDDLGVTDAPAYEGLARAHVYLGRTDLAEAAYKRSVELDADYAIGHFNLAAGHAQQGRFDEAIKSLREVQRIEGNTDRVVGSMVENAGSSHRTELAREYGAIWMDSHPKDSAMLTLLGNVEALARNLKGAKTCFERALQIDPRNRAARELLDETLKRLSGQ
jgi:hypothetical protein